MSKPLKGCCRNKIQAMIKEANMGANLQVFLMASPFILVVPRVTSAPGSAAKAAQTAAEILYEEGGKKVVERVTKSASLPDFKDAIKSVNEITLNMLNMMAFSHSNNHAKGITEGQLWSQFVSIYSPDGEIRNGGGGWDWNPFW